jgi:uncharacterized protein YbgA (DUF1722 family)
MSVPRETVRLLRASEPPGALRLVAPKSGTDWTEPMRAYTEAALDHLAQLDLCGYVLKSRSPTCGMERVRVYDRNGVPSKTGVGVFARALMDRFPLLPVEEEGRLRDRALREEFLDAVFAYARWRQFAPQAADVGALIDFHRRDKYLLRAHSPVHAKALGQLVASARELPPAERARSYGALYMTALNVRASVRKHADTLRHIAGHLARVIDPRARRVLDEAIDDYRGGLTPRAVPVALLRNHAVERDVAYLAEQTYLSPYPKALRRAA